MDNSLTGAELEIHLGERLRQIRLLKNLDQRTLAEQAGVALNAVRHLESGQGARVTSLIRVLRVLDRTDWLDALAPPVSISPMQLLEQSQRRQSRQRTRHRRRV